MIPPDPNAETEAAAGQQVDVRGLAGHQGSLALREDEDARGELDALRDPGEVGEHDERVVERVRLRVRTG